MGVRLRPPRAQATSAQATMRPGQLARLAFIVAKVPFKLLVWATMNIANLVAPDFVLAQIKHKLKFSGDNMKMNMNEVRDTLKPAQLGQQAPNPTLVDLESKAKKELLSFARAGRPLVLNFGSCT